MRRSSRKSGQPLELRIIWSMVTSSGASSLRYLCGGSVSLSLPSLASISAAVTVNCLLTEAIRKRVLGVIGTPSSMLARP